MKNDDQVAEPSTVPALTVPKAGALGKGTKMREGGFVMDTLNDAVQFAQLMCQSGQAIPKEFQGNPGLCLGITMRAVHWGFDPFALAAEAYAMDGRLSYQAKVMAAAVNAHAPLQKPLDIIYSGKVEGTRQIRTSRSTLTRPDGTRKCKVVGLLIGDDSPKEYETQEIGAFTKMNSQLWSDDPDQQLYYFAVRAWARRWAPEVLMGVHGRDEIVDNPQYQEADTGPVHERLADRLARRNAEERSVKDAIIDADDDVQDAEIIDEPDEAEVVEAVQVFIESANEVDDMDMLNGALAVYNATVEGAALHLLDKYRPEVDKAFAEAEKRLNKEAEVN